MKINYPIKYTAMPIYEETGWQAGLHDLERKYDIVCYIVSKCYLINETTKYHEDGQIISEFEVVYPYQPNHNSKWRRSIPTFNLINGYCTNGNKVDIIFDTIEGAIEYTNRKNEELYSNRLLYLPCSDDYLEKIETIKASFRAKLTEYKELEQQIELYTSDLDNSKIKKLDNVIQVLKGSSKILKCNLYKLLEIFDADKFVVYSITKEQYSLFSKLIEGEKITDPKSQIGAVKNLLIHKSKEEPIKLAVEESIRAYYIDKHSWNHDVNLSKVTKEDFDSIESDTLVFYTTETIEDILESYRKNQEINLKQTDSITLTKRKNNHK